MYKYAQLREDGAVAGISFLSGHVDAQDMVLLDGTRENDNSVDLGWRLLGGQWFEPEADVPGTEAGELGAV